MSPSVCSERLVALLQHEVLVCISSSASHSEDLQAAARHLASLSALGLALSESADPLSSFARSLHSTIEPATLSSVLLTLHFLPSYVLLYSYM